MQVTSDAALSWIGEAGGTVIGWTVDALEWLAVEAFFAFLRLVLPGTG